MNRLSHKVALNRYLSRIQVFYGINKNQALESLYEAFHHFLCIEELEQFIIPILEMKLNKKHQRDDKTK